MRKSVWLFTLLLLCSCVNNHRLSKALELAGSNRGELEKVLIHIAVRRKFLRYYLID